MKKKQKSNKWIHLNLQSIFISMVSHIAFVNIGMQLKNTINVTKCVTTILYWLSKDLKSFDRSVGVTWNCIKTRTMISSTIRIVVANILSHPARYYVFIPTSAGELLASYGNTRPVVSASALTWFIRYMYDWNLQFLNNVIINKTKVLLPQA